MAWLLVPTSLHLTDEKSSFGYMLGIEEEAGYYAFKTDEVDGTEKIVISDTLAPKLVVGGETHYLRGFRYNGAPVWATPRGTSYIFTSATLGVRIKMDELREPYLRALIDGETDQDLVGDGWWVVPDMPVLRRGYRCRAYGTAKETAGGTGNTTGSREWNVWEPYEVAGQEGNDDWCGVYKNNDPDDGSFKSIGVPVFKYHSGPAAFAGESFLRSVRLVNDHAAYRGDKGDTIRWNEGRGKYVCGSFSPGSVWFECDTLPTVPTNGYRGSGRWGTAFKLAAMTFDPDTGEIVQAQGVADLALRFDHYGFGVEREEIWLGEVEEWR